MLFDLPTALRHECELALGANILAVEQVGGGDISQARKLRTSAGFFFLKMNDGPQAPAMFETERQGLCLLANAGEIRTPRPIAVLAAEGHAGLLLEYIGTSHRGPGFWEKFGRSLADLHRCTAPQFGLDHDNFIGRLPQSNGWHGTWPAFYQHERLLPQMALAEQANKLTVKDLNGFESLFAKLPDLCPAEPPALIHGDLWSGNFMCDEAGDPVLIDPAASYAHREMDLAMSRLFGGFDRTFYRSYEEALPLAPGFEKRLPVYQLYYLMVHVNLFGGGYLRSVRSVLERFV